MQWKEFYLLEGEWNKITKNLEEKEQLLNSS